MAWNTTSKTLDNATTDPLVKEDSEAFTYGITDVTETLHTTSPKILATNFVTQKTTETSSTRMSTPGSLERSTTEISTISNNISK